MGGQFAAMLLVEEKGVEYERNRQNGPILPIFKTTVPSWDLVDAIFKELVEGALGPEHPDTAIKLNKVAAAHIHRTQYEPARELLVTQELAVTAADCEFEPAGRRMVKGFEKPIAVAAYLRG